jgi:hypothetical protein
MSKHKPTPPPEVPPIAEAPVERNTEAVHAVSNAPPCLLSRAETLYVAHCHTKDGDVLTHFNNLPVVERAAWLAVARASES